MTQHALIARLRRVEEALDFFLETAVCQADTDVATEALSDLRELIREAEGQNKLSPLAFSWGDEDDIQAGE